ncbi:MAG: Flp family type IVb pilin [Dehalococcoidia bacterium]
MVSILFTWLKLHVRSERGQDLVEYALLGGLIAAALIAAILSGIMEDAVNAMATGISECIDFDGTDCTP